MLFGELDLEEVKGLYRERLRSERQCDGRKEGSSIYYLCRDKFFTATTTLKKSFCWFWFLNYITISNKPDWHCTIRKLHLYLQTYNKINWAIPRHFAKQLNKEIKLRIHNITAKAALKFGSWSLGTEEKRGKTFRSSTDEIFETLARNNKIG